MTNVLASVRGEPGHDMPAYDVMLAKRCADLLYKQYPGYLWAVHVDSHGGVLNIFCPNISMLYGYRLLLSDVDQDPNLKCVMRGAGEILERAAMRRGRHRQGEVAQKVEGIKRYIPGLSY